LGRLATITIEVVHFRAYAPFLALLPFFKCILEVVFYECVQHSLQFCLDHLNNVKMVAFQFYLQSGKQGKVEWVEHVVFGQKFPSEKKSVMLCQDTTASYFSTKVQDKVFTHFHAVAIKRHSNMRN
jgi:hypothetical protein